MISLMLFIPSGFFDLSSYLINKINTNSITEKELGIAHEMLLTESFSYARAKHEKGSQQWLYYSQQLAKIDEKAAKELGQYYLAKGDVERASQWLERASDKGNVQAAITLVNLLFKNQEVVLVKKALSKLPENIFTLIKRIQISLIEGNSLDYQRNIEKLNSKLNDTGLNKTVFNETSLKETVAFLTQLERFQVAEFFKHITQETHSQTPIRAIKRVIQNSDRKEASKLNQVKNRRECLKTVQFIASSYQRLTRAETLVKQVENTKLGQFFCFLAPKYISEKALNCSVKDRDESIKCDVSQWTVFADTITADYVAVMAKKGKANVHAGILFLDEKDDLGVFKHELTHLLGFVDEYPLTKNHGLCKSEQLLPNAHNIAIFTENMIKKKIHLQLKQGTSASLNNARKILLRYIPWANKIHHSTPIFYKQEQEWKIGTPEKYKGSVGIFKSKTCKNSRQISVKPVYELTSLEYFDSEFPDVYHELLLENPHLYLMPSFHYNIEKSLIQN